MQTVFPVLLIDDGELDDVRELLAGEGIEFAHLRGGAVPERVDPPRDLLVTTPRRALLARDWPTHASGPGRPVKVVIVDEDSQTLRGMLRRMGFDYLVRRPVHPAALRLLLLRALYRGEDKRGEGRVPIGYTVFVRSRLRKRSAVLADLSTRGCRILMKKPPAPDSSVTIQLPGEISGGRSLSLRGRVVRAAHGAPPDAGQDGGVAVTFESVGRAERDRLRAILDRLSDGPAVLESAEAPAAARPGREGGQARAGNGGAARTVAASERRRHRRGRFEREVIALAGDARRVLIGRDLSAGGMRIDRHEELRLGARVQLAIYGSAREEPFLVNAEVIRDDGPDGLALRFEGIEAALATRLERIVSGLPAVESLGDGETGALGTVLSEIRSP